MPGRISVIVPIYNVQAYLEDCLCSVVGQTMADLEVVMVDDGSSDASPAIAAAWAERDGRFRLVSQPNGGLGSARNTGVRHATGELMLFLDSDDTLPPTALEHLCAALDETGSDFATGNVWRLRESGLEPSKWLAPVFAQTRLRTHVTRFRPLIADRIACNKLWRRSFWDARGFRFPEGVLYEDTPVVVPAHFLARSVDVVSAPSYYWRARAGENRSITQRRTEVKPLVDRLSAVAQVREFLRGYPVADALGWYDVNLLVDDLKPYPRLLRRASEDYRREFLDRINTLLDDMDPSVFEALPPAERRMWGLVRERRVDELVRQGARGPVDGRFVRLVPRPVRRMVPRRLRRSVARWRRGRG